MSGVNRVGTPNSILASEGVIVRSIAVPAIVTLASESEPNIISIPNKGNLFIIIPLFSIFDFQTISQKIKFVKGVAPA
jgi:hypothetical protein